MSAMNDTLRNLVERIEPTARLADVALPAYVWRQLKEARSGVALFHGPRGTGKTMAAHAIARELGTHILRIDLSSVLNKYIGETEKNLDAVFGEAEQSGAVLLFDEADALFGKRSEVRDSHDRHANIDVSDLLQRIEDFDGIVILTTNARSNLDEAFVRKLSFVVEFLPRS
jgi:SpoVK/Ycf46/Vps4 family AAA+-type ATPase